MNAGLQHLLVAGLWTAFFPTATLMSYQPQPLQTPSPPPSLPSHAICSIPLPVSLPGEAVGELHTKWQPDCWPLQTFLLRRQAVVAFWSAGGSEAAVRIHSETGVGGGEHAAGEVKQPPAG